MTCEISLTRRLYADNVIIFRQIDTKEDVLKLQEDLAKLSQWAQDWLMHFNLNKCEHLTVMNKQSPSSSDYFLNNCPISKFSFTKYLGVGITSNLSWNKQISIIINKAHSVRGFAKKLEAVFKSCQIHGVFTVAFVRPIVEYASVSIYEL